MTNGTLNAASVIAVPRQLNIAAEYVDGALAAGHGNRLAYVHETLSKTATGKIQRFKLRG